MDQATRYTPCARQAKGAPLVTCSSVIYFVTLDGGQTVKIGTTSNPRQRFAALGKKATLELELLVAYPGSYKEERAAHRQFRSIAAGRKEFFHLTPEIADHIETLRVEWPNWRSIVSDIDQAIQCQRA